MKLSVCKQKWHLNCKIWMRIPALPQKDTTKNRDLHFYVCLYAFVCLHELILVLFMILSEVNCCVISKSTIYCILVVKWKHLIKIVWNNKDIKKLSSHWKIKGRNASGLSMVLEAKLQNFGMFLKATGPAYELLVRWLISMHAYN